jgi:ribosome maturation factor RimP
MGNRMEVVGSVPAAAFCLCRSARIAELTTADLDATLSALIAPIVTTLGFDLVRVQLSGKPGDMTLQVMAEDPATGQLTLDQCAAISRALDLPLDEADPIDGEYALEVSSPGIDRPLTRPGDWDKWAGHDVRLKLDPAVDGRVRVHGVIARREGDRVTIDIKTVGPVVLPLAAVASAKLVLTPRLLKASRPLDASGADEVIELPDAANDDDASDDDAGDDAGNEMPNNPDLTEDRD